MTTINNRDNEAVFVEEDFVVEVQAYLHDLMEKKGVSRADLAREMGVSRARITQIFSDDCKNFTIRLLARAFFALGEEPALQCKRSERTQHCGRAWESFFSPEDFISFWQIQNDFNEIKKMAPSNDQDPKRLIGYEALSLEWEAA